MNLSTLIVLSIIILVIILSIRSIIKDRKSGKSSCGGQCAGCGSHSLCQDSDSLLKEYKKQSSQ